MVQLKTKCILTDPDQFTLGSGKEDYDMDKALWCGRIMHAMKVNGSSTLRQAKVNSSTQMEMSMMVSGCRTKLMGLAYTLISKEPDMKVNGCRTSSTAKVWKLGQNINVHRLCYLRMPK